MTSGLPLRQQHNAVRSIDCSVWPADEDYVIATGEQLHRLCRNKQMRYLFYAGFATNYCVPHRDYGVFAVRERGYCIMVLRDCTTSIGAPGLPHNLCTEEVFHHLESRSLAGSITSEEFTECFHPCDGISRRRLNALEGGNAPVPPSSMRFLACPRTRALAGVAAAQVGAVREPPLHRSMGTKCALAQSRMYALDSSPCFRQGRCPLGISSNANAH